MLVGRQFINKNKRLEIIEKYKGRGEAYIYFQLLESLSSKTNFKECLIELFQELVPETTIIRLYNSLKCIDLSIIHEMAKEYVKCGEYGVHCIINYTLSNYYTPINIF